MRLIGKRGIKWLVFFLLTMLFVAGCTKTDTSSNDNKKEEAVKEGNKMLSIGITRSPVSFNPLDRGDWSQFYISSVMFNPLVELDEEFNFVPRLADKIETEDNQTFTAHLNPDATWTDGEPVTADDVLFSLEMISNEGFSSLLSSQYQILDGLDPSGKLTSGTIEEFPGAQKVDDHTIKFKTKNPVDPNVFYEKVAANLKAIPKHILADVSPDSLQQHPFMQKPTVTYGAYKFVEYQNDQYVELEANENYFKGKPNIEKVFFKILPVANLVAQLQNGEIDMNFPEIGSLGLQDYDAVKNLENVNTEDGKPVNYKLIGYNTKKLPEKVRQAIAYGINREMIVESLLRGAGEVSTGPFPPAHPYYNEDIRNEYPYDPEKAKQLVEESGWNTSEVIEYIVPIGNEELEQAGDIIAANLKEVGLNVQVQKSDIPGMIQRLRDDKFHLYSITFSFVLDPDVSFVYKTGASNNFTYWSNSEVDQLLTKGVEVTDQQKRKEIYDKFQEIHVEELPEIGLYADYRLRAVNKRVKVGGPKDIGMLIDIHEWDVE